MSAMSYSCGWYYIAQLAEAPWPGLGLTLTCCLVQEKKKQKLCICAGISNASSRFGSRATELPQITGQPPKDPLLLRSVVGGLEISYDGADEIKSNKTEFVLILGMTEEET